MHPKKWKPQGLLAKPQTQGGKQMAINLLYQFLLQEL